MPASKGVDHVDIVIVTYNSEHVIEGLLDTIATALGEVPGRVVVVDNGSTDDTLGVLERRTDCLVVRESNRGYSAGINRGVRELAGSGPILILNPDVRLEPGSVKPLVDALAVAGTGIVAPKVLNSDGTLAFSLRRDPTLLRACGLGGTRRPSLSEYVTEPAAYENAHVVDWALGAALLVGRETHDALGGWDESYFLYSEETDLCLRARDRGWTTRYVPDAVVSHIGAASGQSPRIHSMQILNRVRLHHRRHGPASAWLYFALALASEATWLARGNRQSATAIRVLLSPRRRPPELNCSATWLPA